MQRIGAFVRECSLLKFGGIYHNWRGDEGKGMEGELHPLKVGYNIYLHSHAPFAACLVYKRYVTITTAHHIRHATSAVAAFDSFTPRSTAG